MQFPGSIHWADDIVASLDNCTRDVSDLVHIVQQLSIMVKEATVDKVMAESKQWNVTTRVDIFIITCIHIFTFDAGRILTLHEKYICGSTLLTVNSTMSIILQCVIQHGHTVTSIFYKPDKNVLYSLKLNTDGG